MKIKADENQRSLLGLPWSVGSLLPPSHKIPSRIFWVYQDIGIADLLELFGVEAISAVALLLPSVGLF